MENYTRNLEKFQSKNNLLKLETFFLKKMFQWFGIELPMLKYAPLLITFLFLFTLITFICIVFYTFFNGFSCLIYSNECITSFEKMKNIILIFTIFILLLVEVKKTDNDYRYWYSNDLKWFYNKFSYSTYQDVKLQIFLVFYSLFFLLVYFYIFGIWIVITTINILGFILLYETVKTLFLFNDVKKWNPIKLEKCVLSIDNKKVISDESIFDSSQKRVHYSLWGKSYYKIKNVDYVSGQIFLDQVHRNDLFDTDDKFNINQWLQKHKDIDTIYVNPKKVYQAVLFRDIKFKSYFSQYIFIGLIFSVLVITNLYV